MCERDIQKLKNIAYRFCNSPTFMTWFSFSAKSLSVLVVLPLILYNFNTTEVGLWFLFSTLFGIQVIADLGFGPTFIRLISYAMSGLKSLDDIGVKKQKKQESVEPNWDLIISLNKKMRLVFVIVSLVSVSFVAFIALVFLDKPIENLECPSHGYGLLALILFTLFCKIYSKCYVCLISGLNQVALLRRWEGIIVYLQILSSIIMLITTGSFNLLVLTNQFWILVGILNVYLLQKRVLLDNIGQRLADIKPSHIKRSEFLYNVINPAWKSGLGTFSSFGVNQFSALILVDFLSENDLVLYLFTFRLINTISEVARVPFYANLPHLAKNYHLLTSQELVEIIKKKIDLAIVLATVPLLLVSIFGDFVLPLFFNDSDHFSIELWFLFSLNLILERLGAMHFQMHSLSNKVVWHKANLIYGLVFVIVVTLTIDAFGLVTIPTAMLIANLFYYTPNALIASSKTYGYNFLSFNRKIIACIVFTASVNLAIILGLS
jgi:hypothetical protein